MFVFELQDSLLSSNTGILSAMQRQTAVTAYFSSKQLLLFAIELQDYLLQAFVYWHTERNAKINSSNCLLVKLAVTAVCLCASGFSSAIEYWHTDRKAKINSSNCSLGK